MVGSDFIFWNDDLNFDINKEDKKDILNKDKEKENYVRNASNSRK